MDARTVLRANNKFPQTHDARVADLVRSGRVRVALFLPQYTTDPVTGELHATPVFRDIARALADRIGIETVLMGYQNPREVVECLKARACDVAFMVPDKSRVDEISFSPPVLESDFTCLVPVDSSICCMTDADRAGVSIVAVRNHASTLALSRILKQAELVTPETPDAAFALLRSGHSHVMASARSVLLQYSAKLPGSRVLQDRYGFQLLAMAVLKDKTEWLAYVSEFVEDAKASRLVQRVIEGAGRVGLQVASLANPISKSEMRKMVTRIGYLSVSDASSSSPNRGAFIDGMRQFGYQEGRNYSIESRYTEGKLDRLPMLASELIQQKVDVIVLGSIPAALAAQKATKTIPIVVAAAGDFVGNGLVASLERPGSNITGLDEVVPGLAGERLRLLAQAVPLRSPVGVLSSATSPTHAKQMEDAEPAAASLGVKFVVMRLTDAKDFERTFEEWAREKVSAVVVFSGVLTNVHRKRIVKLSTQYRLPTIHWNAAYVASGGLMSYGPNSPGMYKRSAAFVDKILKGASPSVLPVEYPREFELIINLKTAKELGLTLPKTLLEKADRLLE